MESSMQKAVKNDRNPYLFTNVYPVTGEETCVEELTDECRALSQIVAEF